MVRHAEFHLREYRTPLLHGLDCHFDFPYWGETCVWVFFVKTAEILVNFVTDAIHVFVGNLPVNFQIAIEFESSIGFKWNLQIRYDQSISQLLLIVTQWVLAASFRFPSPI